MPNVDQVLDGKKKLCVFQVDEDEPLFLSLISDLFPGITLDSATYVELQAAIALHVQEMGVVNHPSWNLKVSRCAAFNKNFNNSFQQN